MSYTALICYRASHRWGSLTRCLAFLPRSYKGRSAAAAAPGTMAGVLRAISEQAKKNTAAGGPDIPLGSGATAIGRNVAKAPGLPIPGDWAQVSGKHCRIVCSAAEVRGFVAMLPRRDGMLFTLAGAADISQRLTVHALPAFAPPDTARDKHPIPQAAGPNVKPSCA